MYSVAPDGSDDRAVVTGPAAQSNPAPSPDGRHLAYAVIGKRFFGTKIADLDGYGRAGDVVEELYAGAFAAWSPDGRTIAYSRLRGPRGAAERDRHRHDLYLVSFPEGEARRLTRSPGSDSWPTWSPDGESIAFIRSRRFRGGLYTKTQLVVMNVTTGEMRILAGDQRSGMQPACRPE